MSGESYQSWWRAVIGSMRAARPRRQVARRGAGEEGERRHGREGREVDRAHSVEKAREEAGEGGGGAEADREAHRGEPQALADDEADPVGRARPEGHAHADLAGARCGDERDEAVEPGPGQQEGERPEPGEEAGEHALAGQRGLDLVLESAHPEERQLRVDARRRGADRGHGLSGRERRADGQGHPGHRPLGERHVRDRPRVLVELPQLRVRDDAHHLGGLVGRAGA